MQGLTGLTIVPERNGVIERDVVELAEKLGEAPTNIRVRDGGWLKFTRDGVVVELTIGRNRMKAGLGLDEIGLGAANVDERKSILSILDPGDRYLLPRETMKKFESLESRARYALERRSLRTFWGRFVHLDKYPEWREINATIETEYRALAAEVVEQWDALRDQVRLDYIVLALQVYGNLLAMEYQTGRTLIPDEVRSQDLYVARFLEQAFSTSITPETFGNSIKYTWKSTYIPTASQVAEDQAQASRVRLSAAEQMILEDVRRTAQEQAAEGVDRFIADVRSDINAQVYGCVVKALEGIEKNDGRSPRNTSASLKLMIDKVRGLIFWPEPELDARIASVERMINTDAKKRSDSELKGALVTLGQQARMVLTDLKRTPSRRPKSVSVAEILGDADLDRGSQRGTANVDIDLGDLGDIAPSGRRSGNRDIDL